MVAGITGSSPVVLPFSFKDMSFGRRKEDMSDVDFNSNKPPKTPLSTRATGMVGKPIRLFDMGAYDLIFPYQGHILLIYHFLEEWKNDPSVLNRLDKQPFYRLIRDVKYPKRKNKDEAAADFMKSILSIYKSIKTHGFSLKKRVPVATNPEGVVVPLKGARRVAALMALGTMRVPVAEYELDYSLLKGTKKRLGCQDYTDIIRKRLGECRICRTIIVMYDLFKEDRLMFSRVPPDRHKGKDAPVKDVTEEELRALLDEDKGGDAVFPINVLKEMGLRILIDGVFYGIKEEDSADGV